MEKNLNKPHVMKPVAISILGLTLLMTGSIDSIRNMPATALFGTQLPLFFIIAVVFFLLPVGLISADLSSRKHLIGGIYGWSQHAFGKKAGVLAVWLQWINTLVWYPTILSFIAGTLSYLINPALAQKPWFLIIVMLSIFWGMTYINLKGLQQSTQFASIFTSLGLLIPTTLLIGLGIYWFASGHHSHIHFTTHNIFPSFHHATSWVSLTAILTSFLGLELATVHVKNIKNAQQIFPTAFGYAMLLIGATMLIGSLTIAMMLPAQSISLVTGIMQSFQLLLKNTPLQFLLIIIPFLIVLGNLASMVNWMISPTKGIMLAAQDGYLPKGLAQTNQHDTPARIMLIQAVIVSIICSAYILLPSINSAYWLLTDLSTELYLIMYVVMLISAIKIGPKILSTASKETIKSAHELETNQTTEKLTPKKQTKVGFSIPGGDIGYYMVAILGLIGVFTGIVIGFFPPSNLNISHSHYSILFSICLIVAISPCAILFAFMKNINHNIHKS